MSPDRRPPSVRVELDAHGHSAADPEPASPSRRSNTWGLGIALLSLVGVAIVLVFLRPSSEEETADPDGVVQPELTVEVVEPIDPTVRSVDAQQLDFEWVPTIVRTQTGFVALHAGPSVVSPFLATPPMLMSDDGVEWTEAETTISGIRSDAAAAWFDLTETSTGLSIVGRIAVNGPEDSPRTFVSSDGFAWDVIDVDENVPGNPRLSRLISQQENAAIYVEIVGNLEIAEVVSRHTTIDLSGIPICGAQVIPAGEFRLALGACSGNPVIVTEADVVSDFSATEVFDCLEQLGDRPSISARALRVNPSTGQFVAFRESVSRSVAFNDGFERSNGTFAVIDLGDIPDGQIDLEGSASTCDGMIDLDAAADPAGVLILDPATLGIARFVLPETSTDSEFGALPEILGEVTSNDGATSWLIVSVGPQLWSLDDISGEWTQLVDATPTGSGAFTPVFALSTSGDRVYWVDGVLAMADLEFDGDGELSALTATLEVEGSPDALSGGQIIYATNAVVFYASDPFVGPIWRLGAADLEQPE